MHPSLRPLLDSLTDLDFEEFGSIGLLSAEWALEDVILSVVVEKQDQPAKGWRIRCHSVRDCKIKSTQGQTDLRVLTDHPVMMPHVSKVLELYINGAPASADATIGQLVEAHREVVGDWFDYNRFFNLGPNRSLRDMLVGGIGKLAEGPQGLIHAYARVLESNGVRTSSPPGRAPMWWNGTHWVEERQDLFALIFGDSYFVAANITAEEA
jgi:hypothetical protein